MQDDTSNQKKHITMAHRSNEIIYIFGVTSSDKHMKI